MIKVAVKFGLFVTVCTTFLVMLAIAIGNTTLGGLIGRGPDTYELVARFDDATGLLVGDNVKVAGVPVGQVTGIAADRGQAKVTMQVRSSYPLPEDSEVALRWRNLIGQRYVYLLPGDAPVMFDDGTEIDPDRVTDVIDIGALFNQLGPIVTALDEGQVNRFMDAITLALEGNQASITRTLDDLAIVVQGLAGRDDAIGRLIDNVEAVARTVADRDAQIETMLTNLAALAETFTDNTDLLGTALVEIGTFNADLSRLLIANRDDIDGIITKLDNTLDLVEDELEPLEVALAGIDDWTASVFRASSYGTFLNQDIRCVGVAPLLVDPCAAGEGNPLESLGLVPQSASDAVPLGDGPRSGGEAILHIVGGAAP